MKSNNLYGRIFFLLAIILVACAIAPAIVFSNEKNSLEKGEMDAQEGDITVAAYYFPNWGPVDSSEWKSVIDAKPRFPGHQQPKVPLWGYENENLPSVMEKKIEAAATYGVDVFVFDWYIYDKPVGKYLHSALEEGFLNAKNNSEIKFAVMWCNHDANGGKGVVKPQTFENDIMDYVIEKYFKHPSYWLVDGCPYFSVYLIKNLISVYGDLDETAKAIELFRKKVKAAGFKDLHLNCMLRDMRTNTDSIINSLKLNSAGSYHMLTDIKGPETFPTQDYEAICDIYFKTLKSGGGVGSMEEPIKKLGIPYHVNVSMGYDTSSRCLNDPEWMNKPKNPYPYGPVIVNNTPANFKKALQKAKKNVMQKPKNERIIMLNCWNEWGEGSYLEPDTITKMEYLEAVRDICK
ncbi:glycoside hydrolase family 99-like domain-containing protein [Mariniphaga sediminis]|jgi:hypothetical protein|uniref:glycoside hydrolase family 99-like domain-containing protein n=1 Tax=Mariniphaga sediminis TaxID=1628158 RepID=UPI003564C672